MIRSSRLPAFVLMLVSGLFVPAWADDSASLPVSGSPRGVVPPPIARQPAPRLPGQRRREGARLVEQAGKFEFVGDRIAFFPSGEQESLRVLENLAAERIIRLLGESRGQQDWLVSGTLTEFRGSNYLLVTKAVIRSGSERANAP